MRNWGYHLGRPDNEAYSIRMGVYIGVLFMDLNTKSEIYLGVEV